MPRQPRTSSDTGIYHVMLRGINRQDIFEDKEDYVRMLTCLQQMLDQYDEAGNNTHALDMCSKIVSSQSPSMTWHTLCPCCVTSIRILLRLV